jgi:palmitoyltransferase ZDHHC13/17
LHLATAYGNSRIVRRLLLKGANRYIKNDNNKTAYQIADESNFKTLKKMISENYTFSDFVKFYCNVKIEYRPKSRGTAIPLVFILCSIIAITSINVILSFSNEYALAF